jgi:hypothetical protein
MRRIEKKTWPEYYERILSGDKTYDVRLADFECEEGDILVLREWDPKSKEYTGREMEKKITYVFNTKDIEFWSKEEIDKYGLVFMAIK